MFFSILAAVWSIPCCFYYFCPLESSHAGYVAIKGPISSLTEEKVEKAHAAIP